MALIICPECGREISDKAAACPNCGYPISQIPKNDNILASDKESTWVNINDLKQTNNANTQSTASQQSDSETTNTQSDYTISYNNDSQRVLDSAKANAWKEKEYKKLSGCLTAVIIVIVIFVVFAIGIGLFNSMLSSNESSDSVTEKDANNKDSGIPINDVDDPLAEEKEKFEEGKYKFITLEDLDTYYPNLVGKKIYIVAEIGDFDDDNNVQISVGEGYMYTNFYTTKDYSKDYKVGDTVAIFGKVAEAEDYTFFESRGVKGCQIFAVGDEAMAYKKNKTAKSLQKYLTVTEAVADRSDVSEEEFKSLCQTIPYEDVLRNPDDYKGKYVVVSGKVAQVMENILDTYIIYIEDSAGNQWECPYMYKEGESHLLEGDRVTIYGKCDGTTTSTNLMGKQVTLVEIDLKYFD